MADRGRGAGDRRMTKAERKDDARRRREEIQRQMARRRKKRTVMVAISLVVAGALVAVLVISGGSGLPSPADLLARADQAARAAGCDAVQTVAPFDPANVTGDVQAAQSGDPAAVDQNHIGDRLDPTPPELSAYPTVPPTSGPHAPIPPGPLPAGVYDAPPDIYRAIHGLEHGAAIVWYSPDASGGQLQQLKDFYGQRLIDEAAGQDRVLVAPYDYPDQGAAGQLPDGVQMALVAWHRLETCGRVDLAAAFDFTSRYGAPPFDGRQYLGEAPEAGGAL
ncbi:MAG TPA: DUF3105 domain-containing protein [Actinomycetota bacterium]|nr:DUF3105 domain-containing protein [Actinomycetota bacterium]